MSCAATLDGIALVHPRSNTIEVGVSGCVMKASWFSVAMKNERKVVEVRVINEESGCGSSRSATLGSVGKIGYSILRASFAIFSILSVLAFSFALFAFLSSALCCTGLFGIVLGPVIPR